MQLRSGWEFLKRPFVCQEEASQPFTLKGEPRPCSRWGAAVRKTQVDGRRQQTTGNAENSQGKTTDILKDTWHL